jgi:ATP-dependent RNA helicase DDX27
VLKAVKESGKIVSRVLPPEVVSAVREKLDELENVIEEVLNDEKEEKAMRIAEMEVKKGGKCDEISGGNHGLAKADLVCD